MKLVVVVVAVAYIFTGILALPVGDQGQKDVVARCLVEVLSKALSKSESQLLDQDCKDILQAGVKQAPLDKKNEKEVKGHGEEPEGKEADVKDIEALLKSVGEKREIPEDERSQETWGLDDERDKRSWRPGRYHQKKHKRDEELSEEEREEPEGERSQESWGLDKRQEKEEDEYRDRRIWKPTHRYHHKKKPYKRGDEPSEEEDDERSQESWGLDDERYKRDWKPGRYHQRRHKRDEELSEEVREEPDEERSQESWDFDSEREKRDWRPGRYHQRRHKRDEEPEEERSQESWGLEDERDKRDWRPGRFHQRRHKRDEEADEERSQESWGLDDERDKRDWRPGRYHQRRHKRDEELSEEAREEPDEERSQESWSLEKRHGNEEEEREKRVWKPTHRYYHKKKFHKRGGGSSEEDDDEPRRDSEEYEEEKGHEDGEAPKERNREEALRYLVEKRNPWIYRGYYHPAWYKRDSDDHTATSHKMEELAKLLSHRMNQLTTQSDQERKNTHERQLTPQEEKELENFAAMDMELQKIAAKMHENSE